MRDVIVTTAHTETRKKKSPVEVLPATQGDRRFFFTEVVKPWLLWIKWELWGAGGGGSKECAALPPTLMVTSPCSSRSCVCRRRCSAGTQSHSLVFRSFTFSLKAAERGSGDTRGLREWQRLQCRDVIVFALLICLLRELFLPKLDCVFLNLAKSLKIESTQHLICS